MSERWTNEELRAAVQIYIQMLRKQAANQTFVKADYRRELQRQTGRTGGSCEYRMQNISYVYSMMGRAWVNGYLPAKNVGAAIAKEIEALIYEEEEQPFPPAMEFESSVRSLYKKGFSSPPLGNTEPERSTSSTTIFRRDAKVVAWVLREANGFCESCEEKAPFSKDDGSPYLEVHHLRRLADGGSDTIHNAVALCPNCHREFHYGKQKQLLRVDIYNKISRLIHE